MKYVIIVIAAAAIFFLIVMIRDVNRFVVIHYSLSTDKIKRKHRYVVLSDLHNKQFGKDNEKLLEAVRQQSPEAVFIAGDMITARKGASMDATLRFIHNLSKEYPVYYGMGNHEYRLELYPDTYAEMLSELTKGLSNSHIKIMENESREMPEDNIEVYGLAIDRSYYKRFEKEPMKEEYLEKKLGKKAPGKFAVLLAHNPDYFQEYADWGADLVLSGHIHGGLMKLPFLGGVVSPAVRLFPKYNGGIYQKGKSTMILSRGLGTHTLPIRIFNPGELVVVDINPS